MSGSSDHPSGSRGWNHDWFDSEPFPSPEMQFSAPFQTQGSQVPDGYRTYPVDNQDSPDGQYGWTPEQESGGSQTAPIPTPTPTPPPPRGTRTPYTSAEMDQLFKAYLIISEDPEVGTNQTGDRFWWHVSLRYNEYRPAGTIISNVLLTSEDHNPSLYLY